MAKEDFSRSESLIAGAGWLALIIGGLIAAPYVVGYENRIRRICSLWSRLQYKGRSVFWTD